MKVRMYHSSLHDFRRCSNSPNNIWTRHVIVKIVTLCGWGGCESWFKDCFQQSNIESHSSFSFENEVKLPLWMSFVKIRPLKFFLGLLSSLHHLEENSMQGKMVQLVQFSINCGVGCCFNKKYSK